MEPVKNIVKAFLSRVAEFFPYFFTFYITSVVVALFFKSWRLFFYWPALHVSVVFLAVLSLFSEEFKSMQIWEKFKIVREPAQSFLHNMSPILFKKVRFKKMTYLKCCVVWLIVMYGILAGFSAVDFSILLFGLVSIFFIRDGRPAGALAIIFLAVCPILLGFNRISLAELFSVYGYYFLIITAVTQISALPDPIGNG